MNFKAMTNSELEARKAAISEAVEEDGADLDALEAEVRGINEELEARKKIEAEKAEQRQAVAEGEGLTIKSIMKNEEKKMTKTEERAKTLVETSRATYSNEEVRATLVSSGTVATPTGVDGINDTLASGKSILDYVKVVNCNGMGSNKVAYVAADAGAAAAQTEGSAATAKEATFGYVTISPSSIACYAQISKQAKKQTPLDYEAKVKEQAFKSLRKKAVNLVASALKASTLVSTVAATLDSSDKGVIDEKTLRRLVLAYGGDNDVAGEAILFLNKTDLIAFGDVRGSDKKAVYEITPDGANPNTGIIKDGGLAVKYCLCSDLTACSGTAQAAAAGDDKPTMFYGNAQNFELDLFSDYEIRVSEDFAFTSLMDTIVGDAEVGGDVVVAGGFVTLNIEKASA